MKKCFKCGLEKPLYDFYKHNAMNDGVLGKCKDCTKTDSIERYKKMAKNKDWIEKERERGRNKYHRFKYRSSPESKKKSIENYKKRYPEKIACRSAASGVRPDGIHFHHWSYNMEHKKDVIKIDSKDHAFIHRFLVYMPESMVYKTTNNEILDTREKHEMFIKSILNEKHPCHTGGD